MNFEPRSSRELFDAYHRDTYRRVRTYGNIFEESFRKGGGESTWCLVTAMVLRYRSTSYDLFRCSRRDCHCVRITPGLPSAIGAFGLGICTLGRLPWYATVFVFVLQYRRVYYVCVRADGDEGRGVSAGALR